MKIAGALGSIVMDLLKDASAEQDVAVVEGANLTWCEGALGFEKFDFHDSIADGFDPARGSGGAVAGHGADLRGSGDGFVDERDSADPTPLGKEHGSVWPLERDDEFARFRAFLHDDVGDFINW